MENYKLRSDEVVLYKGNVIISGQNATSELVLTNINLIFINKHKRMFEKEEITIFEYPVCEIKIYEGEPQIKAKGNKVEIYLLETEIEVKFSSKIELSKFTNATNKLLTGETSFQKSVRKIKKTIDFVDGTLGINTIQTSGKMLKNGMVGNIANSIDKISKSVLNKNKDQK